MFQALDQFPESAIERRGYVRLLAPFHNRAVHKIDFCLSFGENILQHACAMLSGSVGALLNELAGVTMQFDSESLGNCFALCDQIVE